jgi:hypothetical protein
MKASKRPKPQPRPATAVADPRFALALGGGLLETWPLLPQKWQKALFEAAVFAGHRDERDESLREQLALYLHKRHPRTERRGTSR